METATGPLYFIIVVEFAVRNVFYFKSQRNRLCRKKVIETGANQVLIGHYVGYRYLGFAEKAEKPIGLCIPGYVVEVKFADKIPMEVGFEPVVGR